MNIWYDRNMGMLREISILVILLALCFTSCAVTEPVRTFSSDPTRIYDDLSPDCQVLVRDFEWEYADQTWSMRLHIPAALYDYYSSRERAPTENYSVYVTDPMDDSLIEDLAGKLRRTTGPEGLSRLELLRFVIAFVQSLPYASDALTTGYDEYPRYPVETLVDVGGDCEDSSILMAAILQAMGHDAVLIRLPEHMAVGILREPGMNGACYDHNGRCYLYLETTGKGWQIGEIPDQYKDETATIYEIKPKPILHHTWEATSRGSEYTINIDVSNMGTAKAEKVNVLAGFDAGDGQLLNAGQTEEFDLEQGYAINLTIVLTSPADKYTRISVHTICQGYTVYESHSTWFNT